MPGVIFLFPNPEWNDSCKKIRAPLPEPFSQGKRTANRYWGGVVLDPVPLPVPLPVPVPPVPVLLPVLEPVPVELPLLPLMPELPLFPMLSFVLILQVSESIFTSVTLKVPFDMPSVPDEVAVAEEFDPPFSHMPFTVISCPT